MEKVRGARKREKERLVMQKCRETHNTEMGDKGRVKEKRGKRS